MNYDKHMTSTAHFSFPSSPNDWLRVQENLQQQLIIYVDFNIIGFLLVFGGHIALLAPCYD